jgi:hypothetical protein
MLGQSQLGAEEITKQQLREPSMEVASDSDKHTIACVFMLRRTAVLLRLLLRGRLVPQTPLPRWARTVICHVLINGQPDALTSEAFCWPVLADDDRWGASRRVLSRTTSSVGNNMLG